MNDNIPNKKSFFLSELQPSRNGTCKHGNEYDIHKNESQNERPTWSNKTEFLMSCIQTSVGLGNIWRFPFTCYENGGGAFLIPYVFVLFIIGKPMYYLEMFLGQFTSQSSVKIWEINLAFRGLTIFSILFIRGIQINIL